MDAFTVFHPKISACRQALVQAREALGHEHPHQWADKHPQEALRLAHHGLRAAATETLLQPTLDPRLLRIYLDPDTPLADPLSPICHPLSDQFHPDFPQLQSMPDASFEALHAARLAGLASHPAEADLERRSAQLEAVARTHPMTALALLHRQLAQRLHSSDLSHQWPLVSLQVCHLWQAPALLATPAETGWLLSGEWPALTPPFNRHLILATTPEGPHWFWIDRTGKDALPISDRSWDCRVILFDLIEEAWLHVSAILLGQLTTLLEKPPERPHPLVAQGWNHLLSQREIGRLMLRHTWTEQPGEDRWIRAALSFWHLWRAWGQTCWKTQQFRSALGYDADGPAMRQWSALWHINTLFGAEEILAARLIAPWLLGAPIRR